MPHCCFKINFFIITWAGVDRMGTGNFFEGRGMLRAETNQSQLSDLRKFQLHFI